MVTQKRKTKSKRNRPNLSELTKEQKTRGRHIKNNGAYFNKDKKYKTGRFYSKKAGKPVDYRSSYEYAFYRGMDTDARVLKYIVEPMKIPYTDNAGINRIYIPDVLVLYTTGEMELCEIKPSSALRAVNVQLKARATVAYINDNNLNVKYRFITEKDIFEKSGDYRKLLERMK